MNRFYPLVGVFGIVWFAVSLGFLPIWTLIMLFILGPVFALTGIMRLFQGTDLESSVANATTGISFEMPDTVEMPVTSLANWNCKNCGGPNIQQVKCEWCGMVKE